MPTVAERLRGAREAKNLTVEQIADLTKIRTDRVRALEEGKFEAFSATIYIRGSVKAYARALKLEEASLMAELDAELKGTEKFAEPPPLVEQRKTIVDHVALLVAKANWKIGFVGIGAFALVVIISLSVVAWKHHQKSDPLKNLPPAVYQSGGSGDTLPLPKK
jgi:cytoskeleton protein RodZ